MILDDILAISSGVRYAAVHRGGVLESRERSGLTHASSSESDRYEELIVNPVLLELVRRRGGIDCGGARWVLVRYGNFLQLVCAVDDGHVSVGLELDEDPLRLEPELMRVLGAHGLVAPR